MGDISLVIGGCRSGKSRHALELAEPFDARRHIFIATCDPHDDEMRRRVEKHRRERGRRWQTIEEPLALPEAIDTHASPEAVVLVDCLTLWISNLLLQFADNRPEELNPRIDRLVSALQQAKGQLERERESLSVVREQSLELRHQYERMLRLLQEKEGRLAELVADEVDEQDSQPVPATFASLQRG